MTKIEKNLNKIESLTKEANKYKSNMKFAESQTQFSMNELFLDITQKKIIKLETISY